MSDTQSALTIAQFKQQLRLLAKPVKRLQADLIDKPLDGVSMKIDNNIYTIDGRPVSIEGNEQITEVADGSVLSILANGFWDTVVLHIRNGEISVEAAGKGGAPVLIYPDSLIYYIDNGVVNCCYVLSMNTDITLFPTVKYNLRDTALQIQDRNIAAFTGKLEDELDGFVKRVRALRDMLPEGDSAARAEAVRLFEECMDDIISVFEDAIVRLPDRKFDSAMVTPEYVVDFFLKGIESVQYFERSL